ncbi:MAG: hypothetical protein ACI9MC_001535 [Kiritimatiellia bacterium]|jgi:hypothetical protein
MLKICRIAVSLIVVFVTSVAVAAPSYESEIRPILDQKCVSCHSCYDAPCQLNLTDPEGWQRGGTTSKVYGGIRLKDVAPTRLFEDAADAVQWREKGFHGVVGADASSSLLWLAVTHGASRPLPADEVIPAELDLRLNAPQTCPTTDEYEDFAQEYPLSGMPYGLARLTGEELSLMQQWLDAGAPVDTPAVRSTEVELAQIMHWESFLNQPGGRERLVARYLYEHFFLAKLSFEEASSQHTYRLVRSATPAGSDIVNLSTRRPNERVKSPVDDVFYYRFELVRGTRVRKSHLPLVLSHTYLERLQRLFLEGDWTVNDGAADRYNSGLNPFVTFAQIPQGVRYQFLLDHSWYFISNFIRGPVCRGPIALNVIQDRFFVAFLDPTVDLDPSFVHQSRNLLDLPGSIRNVTEMSQQVRGQARAQRRFLTRKNKELGRTIPMGRSLGDLWTGSANSKLTVFRHRDSATVVRGWVGTETDTVWVMDYTTLERTYYTLVANFDVFGATFHQTATRKYFDYIRAEAEDNFLLFMPPHQRSVLRSDWYRGITVNVKQVRQYRFAGRQLPSAVDYQTSNPKTEFLKLVPGVVEPVVAPAPSELQAWVEGRLHALELAAQPTARHLPEMSVLHVIVDGTIENDLVFSITRDRAHRHIAYMLREGARLQPTRDGLTYTRGVLGDYPNRIFRVSADDVDVFLDALNAIETPSAYDELVDQFGVRRADPMLFDELDWLYRYDVARSPVTAGRLDLYRYGGDLEGPNWKDKLEALPVIGRQRQE